MNETLIRNWNSVVSEQDIVYFLGDFSFCPVPQSQEIFKQLNGSKNIHAIRGNHDGSIGRLKSIGFETVADFLYLSDENVYLCHFPQSNKPSIKTFLAEIPDNAVLAHGHSHNAPENKIRKDKFYYYDVGVDANNYFPVDMETIKKEIDAWKS